MLVLDAHNTTTPSSAELFVVVKLFAEVSRKSLQVLEIFSVDFSQSNSGSSLQVNKLAEVGLATYEAVWNILASAEGWQVDNSLNWVNVVGNHNELGFTFFDESGNVVKTKLDVDWFGGLINTTVLSLLLKTELLFLLGLWLVLSE